MYLPSLRQTNLCIVAISVISMLFAFYFQYVQDLAPCPLCMTQRVFVVLAGLIALAAYIHNPQHVGLRIYAALTAAAAVAGGFFSSRQLWLQSLPEDQVPACGPPLEYIMENFPLLDALQVLMRGDGNCAEVTWQLFGFSMPAWVLLIFITLALISLSQVVRSSLNAR